MRGPALHEGGEGSAEEENPGWVLKVKLKFRSREEKIVRVTSRCSWPALAKAGNHIVWGACELLLAQERKGRCGEGVRGRGKGSRDQEAVTGPLAPGMCDQRCEKPVTATSSWRLDFFPFDYHLVFETTALLYMTPQNIFFSINFFFLTYLKVEPPLHGLCPCTPMGTHFPFPHTRYRHAEVRPMIDPHHTD